MKRKLLKFGLALVALDIATTAIAGTFLANKWPELKGHVPSEIATFIDNALGR